MRKLKLNVKRLSTLLLVNSVVAISGCSTLKQYNADPPPVLKIYNHFAPESVAVCSRTDGASCSEISMDNTDGFFMISPADWRRLQDYQDKLVCQLGGGCGSKMQPMSFKGKTPLLDDIILFQSKFENVTRRLLKQRR